MPDFTSNLIAQWTFDETSGSTATDTVSGLVLNEVNSPTHSPGIVGGASLLLSAASSQYAVASSSSTLALATSDPVTFFFWVQMTSSGVNIPFSKWDSGGTGYLCLIISGQIYFQHQTAITNYWDVYSTSTVNDGNLHSVCIAYDGTGHTGVTIYIDGVAVTTSYDSGGTVGSLATSQKFTIGARDVGDISTLYFTGTLDEFRVYSRKLSSDDVGALHAYTKPFQASWAASSNILVSMGGF